MRERSSIDDIIDVYKKDVDVSSGSGSSAPSRNASKI